MSEIVDLYKQIIDSDGSRDLELLGVLNPKVDANLIKIIYEIGRIRGQKDIINKFK